MSRLDDVKSNYRVYTLNFNELTSMSTQIKSKVSLHTHVHNRTCVNTLVFLVD